MELYQILPKGSFSLVVHQQAAVRKNKADCLSTKTDLFSGELGERMQELYSVFCSLHSEGVSLYKEQMQSNKKLQSHMKKIGQLALVRRLGIPECFLLVTQRITKYPVLVDRIIQNTEAETEEHGLLVAALALIKDTISQVDTQVSEYDKAARLREIGQRLDPKSQGRLKNGGLFKREYLLRDATTLLHEGDVTWKPTPGKNKDIHAVLLSEVLLLLQEKDQKFIFAAVDNHSPVISLEKLIVREVAHEDKAMFLICATSSMMYEIHTSSREERSAWMVLIRDAVNNYSEPEEKVYEEQIALLNDYRDNLMMRDTQIVQSLREKLRIIAGFSESVMGQEMSHTKLLLRGDATDLQQGEAMLKGAIEEAESLLLLSKMDPHMQGELLRVEAVDGTATAGTTKDGDAAEGPGGHESDSEEDSDHHVDTEYSEGVEQSADEEMPAPHSNSASCPLPEVYDKMTILAQKLYSLQAIITQQDSQLELLRAMLEMNKRPTRNCSNVLLEQEKQRNLEKQKEELAIFNKLQAQHRDEQQRWEKEKERQRILVETMESQLLQRQEECRKQEEKLEEEKQELEKHKEAYQHDLERLRDTTKALEREQERLEQQQEKIKRHKSIAIPGHLMYDEPSLFPSAASDFFNSFRSGAALRGGSLPVNRLPNMRPSLPAAMNSDEIPPTVPPRRESINPQATKAEVPLHLVSTTNQVYKPGAVQQQIPAKLAALSKGKEKGSKAKGYHQRTHSAATIDVTQVVPIRGAGKEGGSMRVKRTASPQRSRNSEPFHAGSILSVKASQSFSTNRRNSDGPPPVPPPFPKEVLKKDKERVIFL
ncbi:rho guanine nucleotide exchange factor 18a isoform X2 [Genypterus blacodes]|uniref:rho guanine nucleotide exchange factor 18a isoform X2 n=1 Tax=Genypterus blacodes TaxID=154954 RepID=UPI003F7649D0